MASVAPERPPGKRALKIPVIFDADEQEAQREAGLTAAHAEAMIRLKAETLKVPWTLAGIGRAAMMVNKRVEKVKQQEDGQSSPKAVLAVSKLTCPAAQADDVNDETYFSSVHSSDHDESEIAEFIDRDDESSSAEDRRSDGSFVEGGEGSDADSDQSLSQSPISEDLASEERPSHKGNQTTR